MYEALGVEGPLEPFTAREFHGLVASVKVTPSSTDLMEAKVLSSLPKCCFILRTLGCFLHCNQRFLVTELLSLPDPFLRGVHHPGAAVPPFLPRWPF